MAFPVITAVMFNNSPFCTSHSKILGRGITVVALNLVLQREGLYGGDNDGNGCAQQICWAGAAEKRDLSMLVSRRTVMIQYCAMAMKTTNIIPECRREIFPGE